ncbi:MAG: sialate O-acetylesterase [Candidatus Latescibacteria bacterium]|nr:sialate O-acetylesterase [Candidatus Latescibacterota bacterium]
MSNTPTDIFLLMGQSNMAGRGPLEGAERLEDPRILVLKDSQWVPAVEPLFTDKATAGAGLGMSFARHLLQEEPDRRIGLVPSAIGGTPLSRWEVGADLYERNLDMARQAGGPFRAALWHQGEADAQTPELALSYFDRFSTMLQTLRATLEQPDLSMLVGQLGLFLTADPRFACYDELDAALRQIGGQPNCAYVSAEDLADHGDKVHFDTPSIREFGRRYTAAYTNLQY